MHFSPWKLLALAGIGAFSLSPLFLFERPERATEAAGDDLTSVTGRDTAVAGELFLVDPEPLSVTPSPSAQPDPDWVDPAELEPVDAELTDLRADPGPWFGRRVRFHFQFSGPRREWQPFLTRFGPADFVAFEAWGDREYPWDVEVFENPLSTLFARRGSVVEASLALARKHQRFEAVGVVRDVFLDEPWIEVQSMRRTPEHVPEGTILHVQRAREFEALEQWSLALDQLQRALSAPLPQQAVEAIESMSLGVEEQRAEFRAYRNLTR